MKWKEISSDSFCFQEQLTTSCVNAVCYV